MTGRPGGTSRHKRLAHEIYEVTDVNHEKLTITFKSNDKTAPTTVGFNEFVDVPLAHQMFPELVRNAQVEGSARTVEEGLARGLELIKRLMKRGITCASSEELTAESVKEELHSERGSRSIERRLLTEALTAVERDDIWVSSTFSW